MHCAARPSFFLNLQGMGKRQERLLRADAPGVSGADGEKSLTARLYPAVTLTRSGVRARVFVRRLWSIASTAFCIRRASRLYGFFAGA